MRQYFTPYDIANTIRMAHTQRRITFVLVEGETDIYWLKGFLLPSHSEVVACHGRPNVLGAMDELQRSGEPGCLAIVDADCCHLCDDCPASTNCIVTDFHDIGIVLLHSPALDKVLRERASASKVQMFESRSAMSVREILLHRAGPIGAVRLINHRRQLALRFTDLNYSRFTDRDTLSIDTAQLVRTIVTRSSSTISAAELEAAITNELAAGHEPRLLCSGHDAVALLCLGLRRCLGSLQSVQSDDLERELRLAFDRDSFEQTNIYAGIRAWEQQNPGWPVIAPRP